MCFKLIELCLQAWQCGTKTAIKEQLEASKIHLKQDRDNFTHQVEKIWGWSVLAVQEALGEKKLKSKCFRVSNWITSSIIAKLWQSPWPRKVEKLWVPKDWAIFSLRIWRSLVRQNIWKASGTMVEFLQYVRFMLWFFWLLCFLSNLFRWMKIIARSLHRIMEALSALLCFSVPPRRQVKSPLKYLVWILLKRGRDLEPVRCLPLVRSRCKNPPSPTA